MNRRSLLRWLCALPFVPVVLTKAVGRAPGWDTDTYSRLLYLGDEVERDSAWPRALNFYWYLPPGGDAQIFEDEVCVHNTGAWRRGEEYGVLKDGPIVVYTKNSVVERVHDLSKHSATNRGPNQTLANPLSECIVKSCIATRA